MQVGSYFRIRFIFPLGGLVESWHLNICPNSHTRSGLEFLEKTGTRMALFWERELEDLLPLKLCLRSKQAIVWGPRLLGVNLEGC